MVTFEERKDIKVFHATELESILLNLDIYEQFKEGKLKCSVCDEIITYDNFGCIYLNEENEIEICCSKLSCLDYVGRRLNIGY